MNTDDIVFLSLTLYSFGFGLYYRKISNVERKKYIGGVVGFLIVLIVSGIHVLHLLIVTLTNYFIILFTDKGKCHLFSLAFSFVYLFFFRSVMYFGIPSPPFYTNIIQMALTLKLVGLAFEVNTSYEVKKKKDDVIKTEEQQMEDETLEFDLRFVDILCYVFNYCGVLTGPYFRYRTFLDHLHKPYHQYDNFWPALRKKSFWLLFLTVVHFSTGYYWPLSYVTSDEFLNRSFLYRYWYIWPYFLIIRSRLFFGFILSDVGCILSGLGVYPAFSKPKSGHGPTENFKKLKETINPDVLNSLEYNYETVQSIDPYAFESASTIRQAIKLWNTTTQYWLTAYIYRKFPYKKFRVHVTMLMSALWHGTYAGYYLSIAITPLIFVLESVWVKLLFENNKGLSLMVANAVMHFIKLQTLSYQSVAFKLLEFDKIIRYYNSIHHCVPILYVGLYFLGKYQLKIQKEMNKRLTCTGKDDELKKERTINNNY